MKIIANLVKVGNVIKFKDKLLQVLNTNTIKPGKGGAYIQLEMRDLKNGSKLNERLRTSENVEKILRLDNVKTFHLGLTKKKCPKHPLYVSYEKSLESWF